MTKEKETIDFIPLEPSEKDRQWEWTRKKVDKLIKEGIKKKISEACVVPSTYIKGKATKDSPIQEGTLIKSIGRGKDK